VPPDDRVKATSDVNSTTNAIETVSAASNDKLTASPDVVPTKDAIAAVPFGATNDILGTGADTPAKDIPQLQLLFVRDVPRQVRMSCEKGAMGIAPVGSTKGADRRSHLEIPPTMFPGAQNEPRERVLVCDPWASAR
jgi:hypothetical protein